MGAIDGISDNGLTIKQRVINELHDLMVAMVDGASPVWRDVLRGDLNDVDNQTPPVASIDFGIEEMINNTFPCSTYVMPVFFTFRFRGQRGLDEHNIYMYYLGLLQKAMLGDHNLNGLTLDVKEVSNAHTIIGTESVYPGGSLIVDVIYKTRTHNPYSLPFQA